MFKRSLKSALVLGLVVALMATGSVALAAGKTITMMGTWGGQELEAFQKMVAPFEKSTGIKVEFTGTRDLATVLTTRVEAGNPPDVAALPNPGMMKELAAEGRLVDLSKILDMKQAKKDYAPVWLDLGAYKDKLQAIFISADVKSLVWYNPKQFAAKGYKVPRTWDEMTALSDKIAANGGTPWAVGLESGAASGWPGTDWIEDIMLRTAGPEVYDKWVNHDIPWTDAHVKKAFEIFGKIARNEKYLYGGTAGTLSTNFGDSVNALFTNPPRAYLHRQATFIQSFIKQNNPGVAAGKDYTFFALPPIDPKWGTPVLGAADMVAVFRDTPETRAFARYLASAKAQEIWVTSLGKVSANKGVSLNAYKDPLTRQAAEILVNARVFRFDGSDLMPAAVGSGAFWKGILDYVSGQDLDSVLKNIEDAADQAYTSGAATNK
ncbi:MAG: ABC transporter substrate-binding protein [Firmicutes bacterium]|nr:ABC transporter substrate-binding protein [Bacillota bacterium]